MLEQQQAQLVTGIQMLYSRTLNGEGWAGSPLKEGPNGHPLTHDILERLGALKQEGLASDEPFEEDLNMVQHRLLANGAPTMQRRDSSSGSSTGDYSPTFPSRSMGSGGPFSTNNFPPTPPNYSPFPRSQQVAAHMMAQSGHQKTEQQQQQNIKAEHPHPLSEPFQRRPSTATTLSQAQIFFPPPTAPKQEFDYSVLQMQQQQQQQRQSWGTPFNPSNGLDTMATANVMRGCDPPLTETLPTADYFQQTTAQFARQFQHTSTTGSTCLGGQPDWNDEEFKTFFDPSPTLLS